MQAPMVPGPRNGRLGSIYRIGLQEILFLVRICTANRSARNMCRPGSQVKLPPVHLQESWLKQQECLSRNSGSEHPTVPLIFCSPIAGHGTVQATRIINPQPPTKAAKDPVEELETCQPDTLSNCTPCCFHLKRQPPASKRTKHLRVILDMCLALTSETPLEFTWLLNILGSPQMAHVPVLAFFAGLPSDPPLKVTNF